MTQKGQLKVKAIFSIAVFDIPSCTHTYLLVTQYIDSLLLLPLSSSPEAVGR